MKFRIRFADQVVGFFIIFAILAIVVVIFLLGSKQRWFAKDYIYKTYFDSATGLSHNMPVQYKGFTIGKVISSNLTKDDRVEVLFSIYDTYDDRVMEGSVIDLAVSPLGGLGGNQFQFYPGLGRRKLAEGDYIPSVVSPEGRAYIQNGLASVPPSDDSITVIINRVGTILGQVEGAFAGSDETSLGRIVGGLDDTISEIQSIAANIKEKLVPVMSNIDNIASNLNVISGDMADPDGLVRTVLSTESEIYANLIASLNSLSSILDNLDRTTAFIPTELPKVAAMITELRITLKAAEDVLIALANNPLLRKGIPGQAETQSTGINPRGIQF